MSAKLGIAIGPDAVRGVLLRAGAITFHQWIALQDDSSQSIGQALRMLLRRLPRRRFSRYRVVVAISSHHSQLRLLEELPPLGDARVLARVVEEDVSRFFLRNGTPILPGGVRMIGADQAWACAFDRPIVLDVVQACRDARVRLQAVVPTVVALPRAMQATDFTWIEGGRAFALSASGGELRTLHRERAHVERSGRCGDPHRALAALGKEAEAFAPAFGAAMTRAREPLSLSRRQLLRFAPARRSTQLVLATGAFVLAVAGAIATPAVVASHVERDSERTLASVAVEWRQIAEAEQQLASMNRELNGVATLLGERRSMLRLLDEVTRALPAEASILTVRADSAGGHVITLALHASTAIAALDSARNITGAELLGPVTREPVGERELERATVRFRWATSEQAP